MHGRHGPSATCSTNQRRCTRLAFPWPQFPDLQALRVYRSLCFYMADDWERSRAEVAEYQVWDSLRLFQLGGGQHKGLEEVVRLLCVTSVGWWRLGAVHAASPHHSLPPPNTPPPCRSASTPTASWPPTLPPAVPSEQAALPQRCRA